MKNKNKALVAGMTALLVLGFVAAANAVTNEQGKGMRGPGKQGHGMHGEDRADIMEELGLTENATPEEIRDAHWQKKLADLGLTEEDSISEFQEAVKAKHEERHEEMLTKLGLGEDASREDIREAHKAYCEENPDECPEKRGRGFGRGGPGRGFH